MSGKGSTGSSAVLRGSSGGFFQHGRAGFRLRGTVNAETAAFLRTGLLGLYLGWPRNTFAKASKNFHEAG
jgi:hypothetical protein